MKLLEKYINTLLDREVKMWSQRSKIGWLKDEDKSTWYFHRKASQRRCRNYIKGLFDNESRWCTQPSRVVDTVVGFYQNQFTSSNPTSFEEILERIPHVVTEDMNLELKGGIYSIRG